MNFEKRIKLLIKCITGENLYSKLYDKKEYLKMSKNDRKEISKNKEFKNKHFGKRCFIIGNGPSIKKLDFNLLKDEITFTVNQITRMNNFKDIKTQYHIWADERFFENNKDIIDVMKNVNSGSKPTVFYKCIAKKFLQENKLNKELNIKYYNGSGYKLYRGYNSKIDFTKCIPWFPTVIDYAICLAIYMGFKEIYLLGCDCNAFVDFGNFEKKELNYAYEVEQTERKRLTETLGKNIKVELSNYVDLFENYELLSEICKKEKIRLINCTEGGLLNSIERKKLEEVLNKK